VRAAMAAAQGGCDYAIALVAVAADGSKSACGEGPLYGGDGRRAGRALALEVHVQLPGVASMQQVSLNAEDEHLTLTVAGGDGAPQDTRVIRLPGRCDPEQVGAKWKKKLKTLTVTLPLLDSQAPAAVGRLTQLQERAVLQDAVAAAAPPPAAAAAASASASASASLGALTTAEQLAAKLAATNAAAAAAQQHVAAEAAAGNLKALVQLAGAAAAGGEASVAELEAFKGKVEAAAAAAAFFAPLASQRVAEVAALQEKLAKAVETAGGAGPRTGMEQHEEDLFEVVAEAGDLQLGAWLRLAGRGGEGAHPMGRSMIVVSSLAT